MSYNKLKNGDAAIYVRTDNGCSYTKPESEITIVEVVNADHKRTGRDLSIKFRRDEYGHLHVDLTDKLQGPAHLRVTYNGVPLKF